MSKRLTAVHWKVLECIFIKFGFSFAREEGDHRMYKKPGCIRPVVIPRYNDVDVDIIRPLMRTANLNRKKYFELLKECK